jgi:hypothetical protein
MSAIREDFVDPAEVWDPELSSPIPKIIGGLLVLVLVFGASAVAISESRGWLFVSFIGLIVGLSQIVPSAERLRAYLRYEAWQVAPQPPPRHTVSRVIGATMISIIAVEIVLCIVAWFAQ